MAEQRHCVVFTKNRLGDVYVTYDNQIRYTDYELTLERVRKCAPGKISSICLDLKDT